MGATVVPVSELTLSRVCTSAHAEYKSSLNALRNALEEHEENLDEDALNDFLNDGDPCLLNFEVEEDSPDLRALNALAATLFADFVAMRGAFQSITKMDLWVGYSREDSISTEYEDDFSSVVGLYFYMDVTEVFVKSPAALLFQENYAVDLQRVSIFYHDS